MGREGGWETARMLLEFYSQSVFDLLLAMQDRTIGTSYYCSSLNYIGYTDTGSYHENYDRKPFDCQQNNVVRGVKTSKTLNPHRLQQKL